MTFFLCYYNIIIAGTNVYYTIEKGDSLYKISKKFFGTGNKWTNIYKLNYDKINDPNIIFPQQKLILKGFYYIVKNGDSLYNIAKKLYGTPKYWQHIYKINSSIIRNPNLIFPNQRILIPKLKSYKTKSTEIVVKSTAKFSNEITTSKPANLMQQSNKITNNITHKTNEEKILKENSTTNILSYIPFLKEYNTHKLILSHKNKNKNSNIDYFLPPQLSSEDFTNVKTLAAGEFHNKKFKDDIIYITVCDFKTATEKNIFWKTLMKKITNSNKLIKKITTFNATNSEGFMFNVNPHQYTFFKDNKPNIITIVKTKIKYKKEIETFSKLFSDSKSIIDNKKVNEEIFILPSQLPFGLKFQGFYLEKIPPEYVSEKTKAQWAKKMVGKMNITATYIDKDNIQWTINLFNLENEEEAKTIYDNLYSKPKQEIIDKLEKNPNSKESERLKAMLEITGKFEPIYVGKYKGWFIQNRLENIEEINFRASYYLITISVSKQRQKENLIKLANTLQIDKILKSNQISSPKQ